MSEKMKFDHIFREYDLRGTATDGLDEDFAYRLGTAYCRYLENEHGQEKEFNVSVGADIRLSSPSLKEALIRGLRASSIDVTDLGICPTPLVYFSIHAHSLDGGIMITGSHNPPEYNGFKVCVGQETLSGQDIQRLKGLFSFDEAPKPDLSGRLTEWDITQEYMTYLIGKFDQLKNGPRLKIAIDAGNGTAGTIVPPLLKELGCEVIELFCEPDGRFPHHHPDPTVLANLKTLQETVVESSCDVGMAFDGDADRLGVVDETGQVIYGDKLLIILAEEIISQDPGAKILGEVKCSQVMYDEIERLGGQPVMWKTGHSLIKKKMKEEQAALAGEMSGHFFFADRYYGFDDAIYACCRLVEILKKKKEAGPGGLSQYLSYLPRTFSTPEIRVECSDESKSRLVEDIKATLIKRREEKTPPVIESLDFTDGVRITFDHGWGLVRSSNTQPVLVLRFEADSVDNMESYQRLVERLIEECQKGAGV